MTKIIIIEKNLIDTFFYLYIDVNSNFMQFHYCLLVHQILSKCYVLYNGSKLTVFDGLSNDNEII
jgi:hypothetical protein